MDTRIQGQSIKKPSQSVRKAGHSHHFHASLSPIGINGLPHQVPPPPKPTAKHSPMPFLPPVSGASAFSNYSNTTGYSAPLMNKVDIAYEGSRVYFMSILESIPRKERDGLLSSHVLSTVQEMNEFCWHDIRSFLRLCSAHCVSEENEIIKFCRYLQWCIGSVRSSKGESGHWV
jgi:hypothetical protein